jgi:hypothetical protein
MAIIVPVGNRSEAMQEMTPAKNACIQENLLPGGPRLMKI